MPDGQVLEFSGVTKRFGAVSAVSDFSARVEPGVVTGFLGPNGAGKTTSLRILLGLVRATSGTATIGGVPYNRLPHPLQTVGAVLEATGFHPGRTAANHLTVYAQAASLPASRVDEALATVGLTEVAGRKVGGFSLGMRQRLGLAYALLGDPGVLVLDEPANGLDPEGIKWMRGLLRELARQGRTVLVSSHLLAEVQQTVDALLIISQGRLVFQGGLDELTDPSEYATVVDAPDRAALSQALRDGGVDFEVLRSGLTVRGVDTATVGALAAGAGVPLSALQRRGPGLEEVFLDLVNGTRVHESAAGADDAVDTAIPPDGSDAAVVAEEAALAADLETAASGAPGAAGGAVAAGMAVSAAAEAESAAADDAEAEADAEAEGAATTADETRDGDTAAPADDPREHAAFAVASTGVIEVVPDDTDRDQSAPDASDPEADPQAEPAGAGAPVPPSAEAGDGEGGAEEAPGERVWAMPAVAEAEPEQAPAGEPSESESTPADTETGAAPGDAEEPAEHVWEMPAAAEHEPESLADTETWTPPVDDDPAAAAPDPEPEPAPVWTPEPDPEPEAAPEPEAEPEPAPEATPSPEPDAPAPRVWTWPVDDELEAPAPAPESESESVDTRAPSDEDADRFFAAFDGPRGDDEPTGDGAGEAPAGDGHDGSTEQHEGGEQR